MKILLVFISLLSTFESHKILVYNSKFGHSHSNYLGQIADILVEAGHNVTSLLPVLDGAVRDGTEKSKKIHVDPDPYVKDSYDDIDMQREVNFFTMNAANPLLPLFISPMFGNFFSLTCLSKAIGPKSTIGVTSTCLFGWQFDEFGVPAALSLRPTGLSTSTDVHSFFDRLLNFYGDLISKATFWQSRSYVNRVLKEAFGEDYPTIAEQSANVAYVFTNSEPLIESAAPTTSRVIDIGGIGAKTPKPLDEHWEKVMTLRPKTILISFGTIAKSYLMPEEYKFGILRAIARFPEITFIWKYEETDEFAKEHASKLENLILSDWVPQVDILAHPNLAAFMTHGGMGSTQETALRGVPGIFIPLFADQPRNAGMMEFNGFGRVFSKWELGNNEKLAATISEVIGNDKYRENAQKVSKMLEQKPFKSRELLIKHVEFAAEFGPSPALRPRSVDMTFIEYNNLDIIVLCITVLALSLYVTIRIFTKKKKKVIIFSKAKSE